jgi:hypothetical protein
VNASPLSATVTTPPTASAAIASQGATASPSAKVSRTSAAPTASWRIGRSREPTRSDHTPDPMRPTAPAIWITATNAPAAVVPQPCWRTRYSVPNALTANCGTTSIALAACSRHSTGVRYGEAVCAPGARGGRTGSGAATTTSTAASRQSAAGTTTASNTPSRAASPGSTSPATATPSGCAVWRMPMARPRSVRGNQPMTIRPHAANTLAAAEPLSTNKASTRPCPIPGVSPTVPTASAASSRPEAITLRSPKRSAAAPQRISVASRPAVGAATKVPAAASERPNWSRRSGTRKGTPYTNAQAAVCANVATASTTHRLRDVCCAVGPAMRRPYAPISSVENVISLCGNMPR